MVEHKEKRLFIELIQIVLGNRQQLSLTPSADEWKGIYQESIRQAVIGVAFEGVKKLPREQWPPPDLKFQWIDICEQINQKNLLLNKRCVDISEFFAKEGYRSCIFKGQGNALMYPDPLSRTPGDIDIWVEGNRNKITEMVRMKFPDVQEQYRSYRLSCI